MVRKIRLDDDVYYALKARKRDGESFSDVIIRVFSSKPKGKAGSLKSVKVLSEFSACDL